MPIENCSGEKLQRHYLTFLRIARHKNVIKKMFLRETLMKLAVKQESLLEYEVFNELEPLSVMM